jgi:vancomycin permeability regulator SanA
MSRKSKGVAAFAVILLLMLHLLVLYFIKYKNQQLPLADFTLLNPGNIINLLFAFFLVTGVIISSFKKDNSIKTIIYYTTLSSVLLILCLLTLFIKLPENNIYVFDQALNKFIVGAVFSLYQLVQFLFISFVWIRLFTERDYIFLRVFFNTIIVVIVFLLFSYFYNELKMNNYSEDFNTNGKTNVGVVLGAAVWTGNKPSPTLASRIDKAAKLYKKGIIERVQLTGGNAPGELSEAEVAFNYIITKDVDSADILIENQTTSTTDQIRFVKNVLVASRLFEEVFIISDQYHLTRVNEISSFYNLKVHLVKSELELSFDNKLYNRMRECVALIIFWCFAL